MFTRRSRASTSQIISARLSKNGSMVTFASDTSFLRHTWLRPTLANPIWANPFLAIVFGQPTWANPFLAKIRG